jgi:hypothetical protein
VRKYCKVNVRTLLFPPTTSCDKIPVVLSPGITCFGENNCGGGCIGVPGVVVAARPSCCTTKYEGHLFVKSRKAMSDTRGVELTKGDTNIKADDVEEAREGEERRGDGEEKESMGDYLKGKVISSLNVRYNDFSNPLALAITIGFFMVGGFIALLLINYLVCPVSTNITRTIDYNTGVAEMQKDKISSIKNPTNEADLKAAGITRTSEICLRRGAVFITETKTYPSGTSADMVVLDQCYIGTDDDLASSGYDVSWCDGYYESEYDGVTTSDLFGCDIDGGNYFVVEYVSTVTEVQESCPTFSAALGAALAYITYLELFFTAIMGYILIKLGICKPTNDRATISNLLKSADNGQQEMEDKLEKLRADVDKLMDSNGLKAL